MAEAASMPGDMPEASLAAEIAAGFGLGAVLSWQRTPQGLMNANWRMTTGTGRYAIKQLRDRPPATVRDVHQILPQLAE